MSGEKEVIQVKTADELKGRCWGGEDEVHLEKQFLFREGRMR